MLRLKRGPECFSVHLLTCPIGEAGLEVEVEEVGPEVEVEGVGGAEPAAVTSDH
ncbi:hypothetical protein KIN20_011775 [Parelaphostrongylus tenuis]|uniref:Uncharacterized protein n=1 Tax=Parelaphostrongylus tenuis TaxID=148309 RepID=A0AAD5MSJ1_PARTN|nr:hypothetical protein KIN20_011775 [Parelaphostrongylus tenuis]